MYSLALNFNLALGKGEMEPDHLNSSLIICWDLQIERFNLHLDCFRRSKWINTFILTPPHAHANSAVWPSALFRSRGLVHCENSGSNGLVDNNSSKIKDAKSQNIGRNIIVCGLELERQRAKRSDYQTIHTYVRDPTGVLKACSCEPQPPH